MENTNAFYFFHILPFPFEGDDPDALYVIKIIHTLDLTAKVIYS